MIFGKGYRRKQHKDTQNNKPIDNDNSKKPGHGRMPHITYIKCIKAELPLELKIGAPCPYSCGGKLRAYDAGHIIRIKGNPIANIYHYMVKKLCCNLCLVIISAPIPEYIGKEKYYAYFKAQLVLLKYYVGVPFYRQENFQRLLTLHFPLSDAT